jgi:hypothetical protein
MHRVFLVSSVAAPSFRQCQPVRTSLPRRSVGGCAPGITAPATCRSFEGCSPARGGGPETTVGVEHLHFHDLRHTGNTLAATAGASTKELMVRMGLANPRAALIYQHVTAERDKAIARALSELASPSQKSARQPHSGASIDDREGSAATDGVSGPRDGRAMEGPGTRNRGPRKGL